MTDRIPDTTVLEGEIIRLLPLEREHFADLTELAKEKRIWQYYTFDGTDSDRLIDMLESTLADREKGTAFPFVIFHRQEQRIIGNTRLMEIQPQHRRLEIGGTWLHPSFWASEVNPECKLVLLRYCFEVLGVYRVQLRTDENNIRSRKAIQKIGGQYEGVFRNDMVRDNGTKRNSAYYSVTDSDWPLVKKSLSELFTIKKKAALYK
jgi:RimJ/RimL family protein N-acetyltransferase